MAGKALQNTKFSNTNDDEIVVFKNRVPKETLFSQLKTKQEIKVLQYSEIKLQSCNYKL